MLDDDEYLPGFTKKITGLRCAPFGPIRFNCKDGEFDVSAAKKIICREMERSFPDVYEKCKHGFNIEIGERK